MRVQYYTASLYYKSENNWDTTGRIIGTLDPAWLALRRPGRLAGPARLARLLGAQGWPGWLAWPGWLGSLARSLGPAMAWTGPGRLARLARA